MVGADQAKLNLAGMLDDSGAGGDAIRDRAAVAVETFVRDQAVPALDSMLVAAESGTQGDGDVAADIAAACQLVDAEVTRFLSLAQRGDGATPAG